MSWVRNNISRSIAKQRIHGAYNTPFTTPKYTDTPSTLDVSNAIDTVDAILYINLEHRKDRNAHILHEIKKIDPLLSKTHRIDAIYNKQFGALGCSLSHIKALTFFLQNPSWNRCMVLEDDFTFASNTSSEIHGAINHTIESVPDFDVILLGVGVVNYAVSDTAFPFIKRVLSSQTTSGYIFTRTYVYTLLANYTLSSSYLSKSGPCEKYCLDMYWMKLMPLGKWYTVEPRIGYQYQSYSDIINSVVDYKC